MLSKESEHYLLRSRSSSAGEIMKEEYNLSKKATIKKIIKKATTIPSVSLRMCNTEKLLDKLTVNENPKVFVLSIGGGPRRNRKTIVNLNIDTYPNVEIVGDAHNLPFKDNSVDGIVINAVLEHVESPAIVVGEIYRILKKGGYVLAESAFLQHYHGYPFHFQNYTTIGHNLLFKEFTILESGAIDGPFATVATLITNIPEDLITNKYIRKIILYLISVFLLPIRFLDLFFKHNPNINKLTNGVYLFAQKE